MPTNHDSLARKDGPPTPAAAREFAEHGPWRLVAEASVDVRIGPSVRALLDRVLAKRVAGLTLGERIALARLAGPVTRRALVEIGDRPVLVAMLRHPRLDTPERQTIRDRLTRRPEPGVSGALRPVPEPPR